MPTVWGLNTRFNRSSSNVSFFLRSMYSKTLEYCWLEPCHIRFPNQQSGIDEMRRQIFSSNESPPWNHQKAPAQEREREARERDRRERERELRGPQPGRSEQRMKNTAVYCWCRDWRLKVPSKLSISFVLGTTNCFCWASEGFPA